MKRTLHLIVAIIYCSVTNAQIIFENHNIDDNNYGGYRSESVQSADIDGDGDNDVVMATLGYKVSWSENIDGKGKFGLLKTISTENNRLTSIYTVDLDNDGDIDVLSSSRLDHKIAWYENLDGKGTFSDQKIISLLAEQASSVYAVDIDNDGDIDVLSSSAFDDKIAWYENIDGQGNFGPQKIISLGIDYATSVYSADIDGDGDMDVLSSSKYNNRVNWHENLDGLGTFGSKIPIAVAYDVLTVHADDFDGDGDMDILYGGLSDVSWIENVDGQGSFTIGHTKVGNYSGSASTESVYSGDIDGDGDIDIVATAEGDTVWYENLDGLGNFSISNLLYRRGGPDVHLMDADMDGDLDIFVALSTGSNDSGFKVTWFENKDGLGNFSGTRAITRENNVSGKINLVDIDGDDDLDLVISKLGDNLIVSYENLDGKGTYGMEKIISYELEESTFVNTIDVDKDGDLDLVAAVQDEIVWFENVDGNGNFGSKITISQSYDPFEVYTEDIDNDGFEDIISVSGTDKRIYWYRNSNGLGGFDSGKLITEFGDAITTIRVHDLDGDNDMDIVEVNYPATLGWYENLDGNGNFSPKKIIDLNFDGIKTICFEDIDNDGDSDLITGSRDRNGVVKEVAWHENIDGKGDFLTKQKIALDSGVSKVIVLDVDNDNDNDIIVSLNSSPGELIWFENLNGLGNFNSEKKIIDDGGSKKFGFVSADDIDRDGDLDLISTYTDNINSQFIWYENTGIVTNTIEGYVRLDSDSNGCDNSDLPVSKVKVFADNGLIKHSTFTEKDGSYKIYTDEGNFTISLNSSLPTYYSATPNTNVITFTELGVTESDNNFCLIATQSIQDVNISIFSLNEARPGFDARYRIIYGNTGTVQLSDEIELEFDNSKMTFISSSESIESQTSNKLTFNYTTLNAFEKRFIDITFNVLPPPTVNIGEVLNFKALIYPLVADNDDEDNVFSLQQNVIGSFDPNDIMVMEGSQILLEDKGKFLHYTIRFQNTGTADAINIKVINILNNNLDWNTFELESTSHNSNIEILNNNEVSFVFNGIYLPDSTNDEPNSHGFINYKIKPKSDITIGEIMSNNADIIFDYNLPIYTNIVNTEIINNLGLFDNVITNFNLFPNPTNDKVKIESIENIKSIKVYNNLGKLIQQVSIIGTKKKTSISTQKLSSGVYFVKVETTSGIGYQKLIKK